jgi:hypothetical protein
VGEHPGNVLRFAARILPRGPGVQHQFLHDYGFSVNYVGTHGVRGYTRKDHNRFVGDIGNAITCDEYTNRLDLNRLDLGWGAELL